LNLNKDLSTENNKNEEISVLQNDRSIITQTEVLSEITPQTQASESYVVTIKGIRR